jgi:hypothetical protein
MQPIHAQASAELLGEVASVRVMQRHQNSLSGTLESGVLTEERVPA